MAVLDIVIPTFDSPHVLTPLLKSMFQTGAMQSGFANLIIVNNGKQDLKNELSHLPNTTILTPGKNLGWERGIELGMNESSSEFICFQNDDTFIPKTSYLLYEKLLIPFSDRNVAAVGPVSTTVSGVQSIFNPDSPLWNVPVRWMIFFMVMVRRKDIVEVGGIDTTLPGGDDMDLSIRLRQAGKKIIVTPDAFVYHHGFVTGNKVYGDGYSGVINGWNSPQMIDRTKIHLIRKHGFKAYTETFLSKQIIESNDTHDHSMDDSEGVLIRSMLNGENPIAEFGCGPQKTVPHAIGVDIVPKGEPVPILHGSRGSGSVADIVADVSGTLPFENEKFEIIIARHIIEHLLNTVKVFKEWARVLKVGGRLIVATPNESIVNGIPLDPTHCHAFNMESLADLMTTLGWKVVFMRDSGNGISFVGCFEKTRAIN